MKRQANSGKYLVIGGLLLLLVVFPLVSWYYLQTGFDYRVTALGELDDYGDLPTLPATILSENELRDADLADKVVVNSIIDMDDPEVCALYGAHLRQLHDQFDERNDLVFVNYLLGAASASQWGEFSEQYGLVDQEQMFFFQTDQTAVNASFGKTLEDTGIAEAGMIPPVFILGDVNGKIRNAYPVQDRNAVKRMVEHIALILPYIGRPKAVVKREKEK